METFEQERREVLESVLVEMASRPLDGDRAEVCRLLLRHLARNSHREPRFGYPIPQDGFHELRQHLHTHS